MGASLKTEAVVLRSMRYGEADRILHLYTPHRGRSSAIAKGVRRARSRFGGRLEPYFRLHMVLYDGRSDLMTVTSAQTISGHPRLREHAAALDSAARACDAVSRVFDTPEPHPGVFALVAPARAASRRVPAAVQRTRPARRAARAGDARQPARLSPQAPARRGPRAAPRGVRRLRRGRRAVGVLGRSRRRRVLGLCG